MVARRRSQYGYSGPNGGLWPLRWTATASASPTLADLIAANSGHAWGQAGSGIYSRGTVLASTHDVHAPSTRKLLVADVPRLASPQPSVVPAPIRWNDYKTQPPIGAAVLTEQAPIPATAAPPTATSSKHRMDASISAASVARFVPAGARRHGSVAAVSGGLHCELNYTASAAAAGVADAVEAAPREEFALRALEGAWLHGVVPTRSCLLYRCRPASNCSVAPLYTSVDDLSVQTRFDALELGGSFKRGDLVLPLLATDGGQVLAADALQARPTWMSLRRTGVPVLSAMLFAPTDGEAA